MASIDDLLVARDRGTIEALLLSALQAEGFPVTDWYAGGVARTIMKMFATGILDREDLIRLLTAGGYLDLAAELEDANGTAIEGWLELLAEQHYDITRVGATFTQKRLTLTCSAGSGPYVRDAGQITAISQAGNYYSNTASVTIPDGDDVVATFQALTPGSAVSDATGTITELSTPLPGVTVVDAPTDFSIPVTSQLGSGTITPSAAATPSPARTFKVRFTLSGQVSDRSAYFMLTIYAAGTETTTGPHQVDATYVTGDVTLTFADGATGTSFIAGDTWYVTTPGEPTIQNGVDQETMASLAQRCRDRWPSLSAIPTESKYAAWVRQCSVEQYLGINRITTAPSTTIAGRIYVYVADQTGTATVDTLAALQAYLDQRSVDIERAHVESAAGVAVTVTGTVKVKRGRLTTVKAAAKTAWSGYLATVPIGGELPNGIVRYGRLWQALMDNGAYDVDDLLINGVGNDLALTAAQVPTVAAEGTDNLTWVEVP